jgi:hypothetical protein
LARLVLFLGIKRQPVMIDIAGVVYVFVNTSLDKRIIGETRMLKKMSVLFGAAAIAIALSAAPAMAGQGQAPPPSQTEKDKEKKDKKEAEGKAGSTAGTAAPKSRKAKPPSGPSRSNRFVNRSFMQLGGDSQRAGSRLVFCALGSGEPMTTARKSQPLLPLSLPFDSSIV